VQQFENENFKIWIEDGISRIDFFAEKLDYDIVDEAIKQRVILVGSNTFPMLGDITKVKHISREARDRLADDDANQKISAAATLINSKTQQVLFNFFMAIQNPSTPSKAFSDEKKAKEWLKKFK
jgi:hypothetical protein